MTTHYAIGIGSNRRGPHGPPTAEVRAAINAIGGAVIISPIVHTAPLGPSSRRYANAVAIVASTERPDAVLIRLKAIERAFGRRRGRRWGARVIDLDILLWSGGLWASNGLIVPHIAFRERAFVLGPLARIAPGWRDPVSGRTMRQLAARLTARPPVRKRALPLDRARSSVGRATDF